MSESFESQKPPIKADQPENLESSIDQINAFERLQNITFARRNKPNGQIVISSSTPGRKTLELVHMSNAELAALDLDQEYEVEIIRDTDPSDPNKGKYMVRLVPDGVPLVEEHKDTAEVTAIAPIEVDHERGKIFVLDSELDFNQEAMPGIPQAADFQHFTLDQRTLETIDKVATAVERHEPCLLEGETSTSKTSSIMYLAMETNTGVLRMNLNGQTDTSELIGKYVPNDGQLSIQFNELFQKVDLLQEATRAILMTANSEGRGLSLLESQKIAELEHITVPEWRWKDGLVPQAMKEGYWLILDEINLAEAQILERLNSVLEKNPSLTLSENGGVKIGAGGDQPVHERFRIFATMNPAEYSGRSPMSPAYKDRWTSYKYVERPTEEDYAAMMKLWTYGEQPKVTIRQHEYQAGTTEPLTERLQQLPGFQSFIARMAKFQIGIEDMARGRSIGKDRKERYIFTRRGLMEFMGYIDDRSIIDRQTGKRSSILEQPQAVIQRAIQYYYGDRLVNADDRKKVNDLLDAIGIGPTKWLQKFDAPKKKEPKTEGGNEAPRSFSTIDSETVTITGEVERHGIRIGTKLIAKQDKVGRQELLDAKELIVEGFTADGIAVIKIDGKMFTDFDILSLKDYFDIIEPTSTETTEPRAFTTLTGSKVETTGEVELEDIRIGDRLKRKVGIDYPDEIERATELRVVGFDARRDVVIQINGDRVFRRSIFDAKEFYYFKPAPETENSGESRTFTDVDGDILTSDGQKEQKVIGDHGMSMLRVGDHLKVKPDAEGVPEIIATAKSLAIAGFTVDSRVIVQIDGGRVAIPTMEEVIKAFDIEPASVETMKLRQFATIYGTKIEVTTEIERDGIRRGTKLTMKPGVELPSEIMGAKELRVVGFTSGGCAVTQIDGDKVFVAPNEIKKFYDIEAPKSEIDPHGEWKSYSGGTLKGDGRTELEGVRIGDLVRVREGEMVFPSFKTAEKLQVVGFTSDDRVIVQIDNNFAVGDRVENHKELFEPITESVETTGSRTYRGFGSGEVEATGQTERDGVKVGDRLQIKHGLGLSSEIMSAKERRVVGFDHVGNTIIQLDGDRVILAIRPRESFDIIGSTVETTEPRKFTHIKGGVIETTGIVRELSGIKVGDRLKINRGISMALSPEVFLAKEYQVVGFTDGPGVIIQLDGDKVEVLGIDTVKEIFTIKASGAETDRPREFTGISGGKIAATSEVERDGIKVGTKFKLKTGIETVREVMVAKELRVVGFDAVGNSIIQLDGDKVVTIINAKGYFDIEPTGAETDRPREFTLITGHKIEATTEISQDGLMVGDRLKQKSGVDPLVHEVKAGRDLRVVGFDKSGNTLIQIDGDKVATYTNPRKYFDIIEPTDAETTKPREFTSIGGIKVEATAEKSRAGFEVGDRLKVRSVANPGSFITSAKDLRVVGFTSSASTIVQINGDKVVTFETPGEYFYVIEPTGAETRRPREFTAIYGGKIEITAQTESGGINVGDRVILKPGTGYIPLKEVERAKEIRVVGFDKEGDVVCQIDGDRAMRYRIDALKDLYSIESASAETTKSLEFTTIDDSKVEATGETELDGIKIGYRLKAKVGERSIPSYVTEAKDLRVVGFTKGGYTIVQIDGHSVALYGYPKDLFDIIEPTSAETTRPRKFNFFSGGTVEVTNVIELGGIKLGDRLKIKPDQIVNDEIRMAKELKVVGFTSGNLVVIQLDGDRVAQDSVYEIKSTFEVESVI